MISKGTKTYKNHTRYTRNIPQFHVMLQRMFSPTINQTLPASIPQLQTAPHRRRKPNQWWVAWGETQGIGSKPSKDEVGRLVCFRAPRRNIKLMVNSFWRQRVLLAHLQSSAFDFFLLGERFGYCCSTRKELQESETNWIKWVTPPLARA